MTAFQRDICVRPVLFKEHSMTPLCWSKSHLRRRPIGGLREPTSETQETPNELCPLVKEYIPEGRRFVWRSL